MKHNRQSIRLEGYNYSSLGYYFITICTYNRECYFDQYSILKNIIDNQWKNIPKKFPNIILDEFCIMPNHIHGIIGIMDTVGAGLAPAQIMAPAQMKCTRATARDGAGARPAPTVGTMIGQFKSLCVTEWLHYIKHNNLNVLGKFWQRNYYEHIIRNENELNKIRQYIIDNPSNWSSDENCL